jgi:hypothetical protein
MTGSSGRSSTPRPIGSIIDVSGILDHPLSRVMTTEHNFAISPRVFRARFAKNVLPLSKEGAGNAGRSMRPQPGGQKRVDSHTSSSHHGHTGNHPALPAQWF